MSFKIGSFNMYKFSYQTDKEISKDLERIKEIIIGEQFDIIAMQEVFTEAAIKRLTNLLNGRPLLEGFPEKNNWYYTWAQPKSRSTMAAEGYGYIWNTHRFRMATGLREDEQYLPLSERPSQANRTFEARIEGGYKNDKILYGGKLVRDPLYARFESQNAWFEVRLINTHIMFSDNTSVGNVPISDALKRKEEFRILTEEIYRKLSEKQYRSGRPSYTILLGDYNLNLIQSDAGGPYIPERVEWADRNGITKVYFTVQNQLTTLKGRSPEKPDEPAQGFANNYDHFTYDAARFEGVSLQCDRVNTVEKYCGNDFELHRKTVSDHVPISLTVSLT